jgi:hypothetical protein
MATEPAASLGGFGNANDSEGEKGRTDMGAVAQSQSVFTLLRFGTRDNDILGVARARASNREPVIGSAAVVIVTINDESRKCPPSSSHFCCGRRKWWNSASRTIGFVLVDGSANAGTSSLRSCRHNVCMRDDSVCLR